MPHALAQKVADGKDWPPKAIAGDAGLLLNSVEAGSVDLVVCSPPYNIGKIYERKHRLSFEEYLHWQEKIADQLAVAIKDSGSLCWQVGNHVKDGVLTPLDIPFYRIFSERGFVLRNRIIWRFNFGHNTDRRFSGRYETVLWFTRGSDYKFNLDPVRIPQIYPGKRHSKSKGASAGLPSGNPRGKNPSDYWEFSAERDFIENPVWDIPNVKAGHPEKTEHPCQFPIELAERCILAMTDPGDLVLDPFVGTGSTLIAAAKHKRRGVGFEKEESFALLANQRIAAVCNGALPMRPSGMPVRRPKETEKVSRVPEEWQLLKLPEGKFYENTEGKVEKEKKALSGRDQTVSD
ncbi:site-specific DNA-methyltransferase [Rhizobium sp. VS19-DR104.2]|nr:MULTISPECIES: site-specific DNA-methyltransferase [unclassified Rhizobium]MBZ5760301.1 site-specific DNA-methyltransferase [Rhizobium sp. VS19-DR96]MBZ5766855.1 site-specific DNA-methyltransferase [Rhizobium sp. VS19-DR129.2]MBZ5773152.1 site-specific DNA-methyltransferase [Rhizobium sp. VS19-DRK62.2]MBZ5784136.1 site-specific DNA-methyltransferase [Rhizobium sp. VS19-DR121]MBZ5802496.1 site-specific DNA-methyltransferase [Rhizobium sp. VS19-DR181]